MSAPDALRLAPTTSRLSRQLHHGQPLHFFDGPPDEIDFELEHATSHPPRPRPVSGDSATLSGEPLAHDKPPIIYVEFEENDPRDPYNFSLGRKMIICGLAFTFTLLAVFDLSSFAIGIQAMREELNMSEIEGSLGISLYSFAFGVAPMFLAPLSEEWGRNVLYISSAIIFALFHIPTALAQNRATVLVSRTILGIAGSTGSTMVGGTISDIFRTKSRGLPMAIFSLAAFTGTGLGAVCCGWVVQDPSLGWRWVQWINLILAGVLVPAMFFLMKETRSAVLLSRMAHAKRKETGDVRYRSKADEERPPLLQLLQISLLRPTVLLFTEPTVTVFSLWLGFAWGLLYGLLEAIPYVFETLYHWRTGTVGLAYLAIVIGGFVGFCGTFLQEAMYRRHHGRLGPEARLYSACAGAVTFPIGCFIFAWTSYSDVHWIGPIIGTTIAVAGIYNIYLSGFIYLADAYQIYSSSALAAQSFSRNIFGGVFPLFITIMYRNLNPRWAATTFGFIAIVCACIPFVLMRWGPYIRSRSKFAQSLADLDPVVPRVDPEAPKSSSP